MRFGACRVAVALLLVAVGARGAAAGDRVVEALQGGSVMETEVFGGLPRWRLLPHLWTEKTVNVSCQGTSVRRQPSPWYAWQLTASVNCATSACNFSMLKRLRADVHPQTHRTLTVWPLLRQ